MLNPLDTPLPVLIRLIRLDTRFKALVIIFKNSESFQKFAALLHFMSSTVF